VVQCYVSGRGGPPGAFVPTGLAGNPATPPEGASATSRDWSF